jgi:hypothetical protein
VAAAKTSRTALKRRTTGDRTLAVIVRTGVYCVRVGNTIAEVDVKVRNDFNGIILASYTQSELRRLHELAEILDDMSRKARGSVGAQTGLAGLLLRSGFLTEPRRR